ncbi:Ig-like domain-containing protein [Acidaminobacter sp.]|uniref:Ig-like domain-containing protein n=1 Tax=Acidaminobacter sp. TaxID=1872102 RepID=UPI001385D160|nr:Ig-like domain-containing protein [Acidaminobacter sp.]MDK9710119.1 Ig-like domain-containing protein [Acidaminobacter sp.]MZQ98795.1 tandem-95 repeat protein [Acidaminobacter sp.]
MKPGYLMKSLSLAIVLILMMTTLNLGAYAAKPGTTTPVTITTLPFTKTLAVGVDHTFEVVAKYGTSKELTWVATSGHLTFEPPVSLILKKGVAVSEKAMYTFTNPGPGTHNEVVTVKDGYGNIASLKVTFIVEGGSTTNNPPIADNLSLSTNEDQSVIGTIIATDQDRDALTASITSAPANGSASINGMLVTYTPALNFNGSDTFVVTVSDGKGGTDPATVSVTVTPVDDPPTAVADSASTTENTSVTIDVLANDTDIDGGEKTITELLNPQNGIATLNADQSVSFEPTQDFVGTGSFEYSLDGGSTALVTVAITGSEPQPLKYVALGDSIPYGRYYTSALNYLFGGTDTDSYVEQLARSLGVASVDFFDASVSGYNTVEVFNQINSISAQISAADVITLCVGANDIMDAAGRGTSGLLKYDINWTVAAAGRDSFELYWPQLIDRIEFLNPDVTLVVMTIYNPYRLTDSFYNQVDPYFSASTSTDLGLNHIIRNTMSLEDTAWGDLLPEDFDYRVADVYTAFNTHTNKDSLTGFYRSFCDPHPNQLGQNVIFNEHLKLMGDF